MALHKYVNDTFNVYLDQGGSLYHMDPRAVCTAINPQDSSGLESIFPGSMLPLYSQSSDGFGVIYASEFVQMPINERLAAIVTNYELQWII